MMRKHILVLDDDAALRSLLKLRLESTGHTVDTAENGWDGLSKLEHADYNVVLLDNMMPGITGLTVLQHIQARHPSVPVVMMTGYISSQVAAQAFAAGGGPACSNPWILWSWTRPCSAVPERLRKSGCSRLHETKSRETRQVMDR
jgi:two-component system alkaline phosphatase synthesis response regulator PhoP/two-component system response regulator ResD